MDAPYITRAPTPCSSSPYPVVNSSPAETAWPYLPPARVVELVSLLAVAGRADNGRRVKDAWGGPRTSRLSSASSTRTP